MELTPEQIDDAIMNALEWYQGVYGGMVKRLPLTLTGVAAYTLPEDVMAVCRVIPPSNRAALLSPF
ncbi:hypothetical protein KKG24_05230, partial [Patescibacteria group bacterium]|nr:hypothetical protein [Patescibacteria group bacterium]